VFQDNPVVVVECYDECLLVYASVFVIAVYQAWWMRRPVFVFLFFKLEDSGVSSPLLGLFDGKIFVFLFCGSRGERRKLSLMSPPRLWGNKELSWYGGGSLGR
jgi:hypothetical protein